MAPLLALLVPETHQYRVVKKQIKDDPAAAKLIVGEYACTIGDEAFAV